jgi:uncharacterized protein
MIRPDLVKMLVCPETRGPLTLADGDLVAKINKAAAAGRLKNKAGRFVEKPLDAGLVREDQRVLYPVIDDIPMMLVDESIPLDQPGLN